MILCQTLNPNVAEFGTGKNKEYAMSILRTEGIIKDYPGTRALDDVTVSFNSGKVHAFIGKNGSGKSTLVKVFAGAIQPTSGHFYLDEEELHFSTPVEALNKGIATVYQELSLVPHLSVAENIFWDVFRRRDVW